MRTRPLFFFLVAPLLAAACTTVAPLQLEAEAEDVDAYVGSLPQLEVPPAQPKTEVACEGQCPKAEQVGDYYCSYARFQETAQFDRFVALQPNSATLWPGNVVRGEDAANGVLTPIGVELAPVTFSVSLENLAGSPAATMEKPSLSSFRLARNAILASGVTGATPASLDFEVRKVSNESQLAVALGASASWPGGADIAASFDFNSSSQKTKILVNFTQAYYTIDVDTPVSPAKFFAPGTTVVELSKWMNDASPPVYVQSITYGRRVIFSVQTNASAEEVKAALEAAYKGVAVEASGSISVEQKNLLRDSTIRAFVLGGSGDDAAAVIDGFDSLAEYIKKGGSYSPASPGAPIAYKLSYLDNTVTKLAFTTDYAERTCVRNRVDMRVSFDRLEHLGGDDWGDNVEIYGSVTVRYPTKSSPVTSCTKGGLVRTLWNVPVGSWVNVKEKSYLTIPGAFADINDIPVSDTARICISASFREEDWGTNEAFGSQSYGAATRLVEFQDGWSGEHKLVTYGDNDNSMSAIVKVTTVSSTP
ncbi:MAG: thiol-activated cytolysin family protein [Deltaproteobacteria bacterium]|nr:thiol-activated cytolysin family protein [Deltaproteobacteria bacterium]